MDALSSETKASGGNSEDQFNRVLKYPCHLATTDSLSDNSFPFANLVHQCFGIFTVILSKVVRLLQNLVHMLPQIT